MQNYFCLTGPMSNTLDSEAAWQTVQILIGELDLDIHCFLERIYLGSAEQGLKQYLPFLCCK